MKTGRHIEKLGNTMSVSLPEDSEGYTDRECPHCLKPFKIGPGAETLTTCTCPYCGALESLDEFHSKEQIRYITAIVEGKFAQAVTAEMEDIAQELKGGLISMSVQRTSTPRPQYRHSVLPTKLKCSQCSFAYAIEGSTGRCPHCGENNEAVATEGAK